MADKKQGGLGDELFGTRFGEMRDVAGPMKGEFVPPPDVSDKEEIAEALPEQEEFWRAPVRFGSIPVEKEPLGWDRRRGFHKLYPQVMLPTQVVERVSFGHPELEPNRLFWGDNLHVMRQLPSESIDLIYIDPPFFSGKQYNVIFGDQNELRSFSDIWEGGMPGYLVWLNARLYEMKRLLKKTGAIYVHLDWHSTHYVKQEMDKLFGASFFLNEIIWHYKSFHGQVKRYFPRKHDAILVYTKGMNWTFNRKFSVDNDDTIDFKRWNAYLVDGYKIIGKNMPMQDTRFVRFYKRWVRENGREPADDDVVYEVVGQARDTVWDIKPVDPKSSDRIGYPTQKPEELLQMVIECSSKPGDVVADFFCGGGTTPAVAQRLGRRWIACDQSRVAVAITADRVAKLAEQMPLEQVGKIFTVPDFTVEHWGIYEARRLSETPPDQFRQFVLRAYGAVPLNTTLEVAGTERRLKPDKELMLFRIAQEALRNAKRHSGATSSTLKLEFTLRKARLTVFDNGKGFELPKILSDLATDGKLGLIGMQERARLLDAKFRVKSQADKGSRIAIAFEI